MVRLAIVVVLELVVVVFLALQLAALPDATGAATPSPAARAPAAAPSHPQPDPAGTEAAPTADGPAPAPAQRDEVLATWRADDPAGVLLVGAVRWADGEPVTEPRLWMQRDGKRVAVNAARGTFAASGLTPGTWDISVRADNAVDSKSTVDLSDAAVQTHDLTLDRSFPVRVRIVTADGQDGTTALRQAKLWTFDLNVVGRRERFSERLAPTDYGRVFAGDAKWDSQMNPKDGFAGTLHFAAAPPAHAALLLRHVVMDQQLVQPDQQEVTFTIDVEAVRALTGSVTVRVLDADTGAPVKASISLNSTDRGGGGQPVDDDGRATVDNLPPGLLRLMIAAPGHEQLVQTVAIDPGQKLDLGERRLGAALPLTGRVLDADGKPCATASLGWTELKWRTAPTAFVGNRSARPEADGTFQLWGTGRGRIAVHARGADGSMAVGVFDNPPTTAIELRLAAAATLKVRRPDDPGKAYTVTLFDAQRQPVAASTFTPGPRDGSFELPPGSYGYEVHDESNRPVQNGSVTLGGEPVTLEIR